MLSWTKQGKSASIREKYQTQTEQKLKKVKSASPTSHCSPNCTSEARKATAKKDSQLRTVFQTSKGHISWHPEVKEGHSKAKWNIAGCGACPCDWHWVFPEIFEDLEASKGENRCHSQKNFISHIQVKAQLKKKKRRRPNTSIPPTNIMTPIAGQLGLLLFFQMNTMTFSKYTSLLSPFSWLLKACQFVTSDLAYMPLLNITRFLYLNGTRSFLLCWPQNHFGVGEQYEELWHDHPT